MSIREDKSYLSSLDLLAIEKGIAKLDVYSIRIDREQFSEEEKIENQRIAKTVSREEWSILCDQNKERTAQKIEPLIESLNEKFVIHQYKDNGMEHYRSNWDLFFWCNGGNKGRDYSYITLSTNKNRTVEERQSDIKRVLDYVQEIGFEGIEIIIQYTATYNNDMVKQIAINYFAKVQDTFINYMGYLGRLKVISQNSQGEICYGFFKKGASKKYYQVSDITLLGMALNN